MTNRITAPAMIAWSVAVKSRACGGPLRGFGT